MPEITYQQLEPYFKGKKKHSAYADSVNLYNALKVHANGDSCDSIKLITERRPAESDEVQKYRKVIFEPITKDSFKRVLLSLQKIRRSPDWSIRYEEKDQPANLPDKEQAKEYTEVNFPHYGSVTNWVFTVLLKNYLVDPNGVVLLVPKNADAPNNEFLKPFPYLFNSNNVLEYMDEQLAVLKSDEQCAYKAGNTNRYDGEVFFVATPEVVQRWEQSSDKKDYILVMEYVHSLGYMPAFRMWADFYKQYGENRLSESKVSSMVPRLNEMLREYSDLQAAVVQHLYPEAWEWASMQCDACVDANSGISTGRVMKGKKISMCTKCNGSGQIGTSGPYKKLVIRGGVGLDKQQAPNPPKGYVEKPVDIIKIQDERIDKHQFQALASVNMHFLLQTPANQSGYAKDVDRDDLNQFVYGIAEDLVAIMDKIYAVIIDYRYLVTVPDAEQRREMAPYIAVPEKFDILSLTYLLEELTKAISGKVSPAIIVTLMKEYVNKKFYNNKDLADTLSCMLDLDPLAGISEDEKASRHMNGGITDLDFIISCNIMQFVQRAMLEEKQFMSMELLDQKKVMEKYATEKQKQIVGVQVSLGNPETAPPAGGG